MLITPVAGSVRLVMINGALPRRVLPDPLRPSPILRRVGTSACASASTLQLSRPARASHALRPARLLVHLKWTLSRDSGKTGYKYHRSPPIVSNHQLF